MVTGDLDPGAVEELIALCVRIALRTQHASGRWDELWPARTAQPGGPRSAI